MSQPNFVRLKDTIEEFCRKEIGLNQDTITSTTVFKVVVGINRTVGATQKTRLCIVRGSISRNPGNGVCQ